MRKRSAARGGTLEESGARVLPSQMHRPGMIPGSLRAVARPHARAARGWDAVSAAAHLEQVLRVSACLARCYAGVQPGTAESYKCGVCRGCIGSKTRACGWRVACKAWPISVPVAFTGAPAAERYTAWWGGCLPTYGRQAVLGLRRAQCHASTGMRGGHLWWQVDRNVTCSHSACL
jgi:hypothetical protein